MNKTLGMRIAEYRKAKGMKQDELAEKLGVSAQAVSKWENDLSCPDIMLLPSLAKIFDTTTDELLSGKKEGPIVKVVPPEQRKSFDELMLRIKVDSIKGEKVRVNLPMPLIKATLECASGINVSGFMGGSEGVLDNIDFAQIIKMVESGMIGKLVEIDDGEGNTVEIVVE
jgi:transcriptional regulator with XRE-family HTH domain